MGDQQFIFKRVGMVPVDRQALLRRERAEVAVIRILLQQRDLLGADRRDDRVGHGGFARPATARDADDQWFHPDAAVPSLYPPNPSLPGATAARLAATDGTRSAGPAPRSGWATI